VGKAALKGGARWLAVARVNEGMELRAAGISAPVLVLGMVPHAEVDLAVANSLTLPLPSFEAAELYAQRAKALGRAVQVHLKVDSGMGRLGVLPDEILPLAQRALELGGIELNGLYSHFGNSSVENSPMMDVQLRNFTKALDSLESSGIHPKWVHLSNSGASLAYPPARFNMVRGGSVLVGFNPFDYQDMPEPLEQALTAWKARLVSCKTLPSGWKIGYGSTYVTEGEEIIGIVAAGFGDGVRRVPGNEVLLDGQRMPVVGATCMDAVMVKLPKAYPLDSEVQLVGVDGDEKISVEDIAARYNTVHVDFMMGLTARVQRVYYWD
jgi:alanine racemase